MKIDPQESNTSLRAQEKLLYPQFNVEIFQKFNMKYKLENFKLGF